MLDRETVFSQVTLAGAARWRDLRSPGARASRPGAADDAEATVRGTRPYRVYVACETGGPSAARLFCAGVSGGPGGPSLPCPGVRLTVGL
jgi:hypothetical protein